MKSRRTRRADSPETSSGFSKFFGSLLTQGDFSRLGRHNARVLLLLDEFKEQGKHLIVIDDHFDSLDSSDDTVGIKTWFNERYVKDTSRKIKMCHQRQAERRHSDNKTSLWLLPG